MIGRVVTYERENGVGPRIRTFVATRGSQAAVKDSLAIDAVHDSSSRSLYFELFGQLRSDVGNDMDAGNRSSAFPEIRAFPTVWRAIRLDEHNECFQLST